VINFSSDNMSNYDEDELERLRSVGIKFDSQQRKRNKRKDLDPAVRAEKEAKLYELQAVYNASRQVFNETKKQFCKLRSSYEHSHHLTSERCEYPSEQTARWQFKEEEDYERRKLNRKTKVKPPIEGLERRRQLEQEKQLFKRQGLGLFDDEKSDDVLYARYKELKKRRDRSGPFATQEDRERYEEERKEYEGLRKRFQYDTASRQRPKRQEKKPANRTELDDKIDEALADLRRLEKDKQVLREDMEDFEKLRVQIERRESHDNRKLRRVQKRELLERKRRKEEWDPNDGAESLRKQLEAFEDVELEYESSCYDDKKATSEANPDDELESESKEEHETSEESSEETSDWDRKRRTDEEIELKRQKRDEVRKRIDPTLEIIPVRKRKERLPFRTPRVKPQELYRLRFGKEDGEGNKKKSKYDPKSVNPDDDAPAGEREIQEDELGEEEL
jgi:hypothetical protein